jgi:hypothetical protein
MQPGGSVGSILEHISPSYGMDFVQNFEVRNVRAANMHAL